jgi:hypothetical protein
VSLALSDEATRAPSPGLPEGLSRRYVDAVALGEGRSGVAWRAHDVTTDRDVVVKVAHRDESSSDVEVRRCRHEARLLSRLAHPNVLEVLDAGDTADATYWVSPFVPGGTVRGLLVGTEEAPAELLPVDRVLALLGEAAAALEHAYERGIAHGALSPSQILLDQNGSALVTGFQVDLVDAEPDQLAELAAPAQYRAPERRAEGLVGPLSDQYALGLIAYELLTGAPRDDASLVASLEVVDVPDLSAGRPLRPGLRHEVSEAIQRATLRDPAWRYPTVGEFVQALVAAVTRAAEEEAAAARRRSDEEERARAAEGLRRRMQLVGVVVALALLVMMRSAMSIRERMAIDRAVAEAKAKRADAEAAPPQAAPAPGAPANEPPANEPPTATSSASTQPSATPEAGPTTGAAAEPAPQPRGATSASTPDNGPSADAGRGAGPAAVPADRRPGTLIIAPISPSIDAKVAVDSRSRGTAPLLLPLTPGTHSLTLSSRVRVTPSDTVIEMNPGQTTTVVVRLARSGARRPRPAALPVRPAPAPSGRAPRP